VLRVMLRDPVFVAGSGNTYERAAIERYAEFCTPNPNLNPKP